MTVIRPNSVAGINSITVQSGNSLSVHKSNGELIRTLTSSSGVSTFSSISVGTATTDNSAAKSINIGLGASISQHDDNALTFGTNGDPRITIDASGNFNVGSAATIKAGGNATFSGIVTATSFKGDGSGLSGISAGTSLSGSTDSTICTVTGANAIQGETNLKFDGSALSYSSGGSERFNLAHTSGGVVSLKNPSNAALHFGTNDTERVRIMSNGDVGINTSVINRADAGRPCIQFDYGGNDGSEGLEIRLSNSTLNGNAATDNAAITYIGQNLGITNRENGVITFRNNGLERIRIQADGKIGLGTDVASSPVQIYGNTGAQGITDYQTLTLQSADESGAANTGAGIMFLGHDGSGGAFHGTIRCLKENGTNSNRNSYMSFGTRKNGSDIAERLRIDSDGNVGINRDNPTFKLDVNGTFKASGNITLGGVVTFDGSYNQGNSSSGISLFGSDASAKGVIVAPGTEYNFRPSHNNGVDLGTSGQRWKEVFSNNSFNSSDRNIKNTITDSDLGLSFINKLRPVSYKWIQKEEEDLDTKTHYGLIAQEIEDAVVSEGKTLNDFAGVFKPDAYKEDGTGEAMALAYGELISPLIKAVQELSAKVTALEGG